MGRENALKDYVEVNVRIMKFYEKYPEGRITTELVKWENDVIVMKATAYRDNQDIPASTGYAYEKEGSSFINKTSALENCETSAVGRCLAILGFEIKKSVASREEVANAQLQQLNIKPNMTPVSGLSEAQLKRLFAIGNKAGFKKDVVEATVKKMFGCEPKDMTKDQYNTVCERLEKKVK